MSPAMDSMRSAGRRGLKLAPVAALLASVAALLLGNGADSEVITRSVPI